MKNALLYFLFSVISTISFAGYITISGKAFLPNEPIKVGIKHDPFTLIDIHLAIDNTTADSSFSFTLENTGSVKEIYLEMNDFKGYFYVDTTGDYEVQMLAPIGDFTPNQANKRTHVLILHEPTKINRPIREFNQKTTEFLTSNYKAFISMQGKTVVKEYVEKNKPIADEHPFVFAFKQYALTSMIYAVSKKNYAEVQKEMFEQKPVLLHNPTYTKFLKEFYGGYLGKLLTSVVEKETVTLLKSEHPSFAEFIKLMSQYKPITNPELAELVAISELFYFKDNPATTPQAIVHLLKGAASTSAYTSVQSIATRMHQFISGFGVGVPAPEFTLLDTEGNEVSLSSFRGKYVYLDFWATWCSPCIRSMPMLEKYQKDYGDFLEVVSISIDKKDGRWKRYLKDKTYTYTHLHYGLDTDIQKKYRVDMIPTYYFISPSGILLQAPALSPAGGIEPYFKREKKRLETPQQNQVLDWNRK